MADLIDRNKLLKDTRISATMSGPRSTAKEVGQAILDVGNYIINIIKKEPTVETVKHAHWIENEYCGYYACSNCDGIGTANGMSPIEDCHLNYCPYCGAKMDEVADKK